MPARTSVTPWGWPGWLSLFFRFPENEIQRIFLAFFTVNLDFSVAGFKIINVSDEVFDVFSLTALDQKIQIEKR